MHEFDRLLQSEQFSGEKSKLDRARSDISKNGHHGLKLLHLNATHEGGGVVTVNTPLIPSLRRAGFEAEWMQITALLQDVPEEYFEFTKTMHNFLQGQKGTLADHNEGVKAYNRVNAELAEKINFGSYDIIIVDDPQPLASEFYARQKLGDKRGEQKWIWRCHIDLTQPNPDALQFLMEHLCSYDAAIFSMDEYVPPELKGTMPVLIIPPGINPYHSVCSKMGREEAFGMLAKEGINMDSSRPVISQVSRFDPWKDPLGVIEVYKLAKKELPGLQLLLNGQPAADDPEGARIYGQIMKAKGNDKDMHVYLNEKKGPEAGLLAAATHMASDVVLQKSLREGYGLTVSEALWKGKLVIANKVGGIPLQIRDGVNGVLVDPLRQEEMAEKIVHYIKNPEDRKKLEQNAGSNVRTVSDVAHDYVEKLPVVLSRRGSK